MDSCSFTGAVWVLHTLCSSGKYSNLTQAVDLFLERVYRAKGVVSSCKQVYRKCF